MKISIINSYPSNTGDLALLESCIYGVRKSFKGCHITVYVNPLGLDRINYLDVYKALDYEYVMFDFYSGKFRTFAKRVFRKILGTPITIRNHILPTKAQIAYLKNIKHSDIIISSPGSYLNDIYDISDRLAVFELLKKKTSFNLYFLSLSIGPFFHKSSSRRIKQIFDSATKLILRENYSKHLFNNAKTCIEFDICFLLAKKYHFPKKPLKKLKSLVVSFRSWKDLEEEKIVSTLEYLINNRQFDVTFLSTCQGVPDYVDDSHFMQEIKNRNISLNKLEIIESYHNPEQLLNKYHTFDAYVGMRLHGALLALIAGIPSFCISYEHKSKGIFEMLDFSKYEISHSETKERWIEQLNIFLDDYETIQPKISALVEGLSTLALKNISHLK